MPPDVGAAVVAYLRDSRSTSSCRRLFLRTLAPHVGFASGCAITMIAKAALEHAGVHGYAHHGAHIFRHSLATELLRSGATLSEIGQLLRHESHDTTRIYAKVDRPQYWRRRREQHHLCAHICSIRAAPFLQCGDTHAKNACASRASISSLPIARTVKSPWPCLASSIPQTSILERRRDG
jgi:hypothetical protein